MKQIHIKCITAVITCIIFATTLLVSCTKYTTKKNGTIIEPCKNVVCYNGGTCVDGSCNCPQGFGGLNCSELWNDAYVGSYEANDQCDITNKYNITISKNSDNANQIVLNGISKFCTGIALNGVIRPERTSVDFTVQRFCDSLYVSGTATQAQDKSFINVWLSSRDSNNHKTSDCSIVLRKL